MSFKFNAIEGCFDIVEKTSIGSNVINGTAGSILFIDASGNLAEQNPGLTFDGTNLILGADNAQFQMGISGATDYYQTFDGTDALFYTSGDFVLVGGNTIRGDYSGTANLASVGTLTLGNAADDTPGNVYLFAGNPGGAAPYGKLYLGHNGTNQRGEVWFYKNTPAHFGDYDANSARIYHDDDDLIIDARWTGTGGTLLFPTGIDIQGDINFTQIDEIT